MSQDPPAEVGAQPAPHPEHPAAAHGGGRMKLAIAVLIAAISIVAALTTWRAEVAGSSASEANRNGGTNALSFEGATVTFLAQAQGEQQKLLHYLDVAAATKELAAQAAGATDPAVKADLTRRLQVEQRVVEDDQFTYPAEYVTATGTFDVDRRVTDLLRQNRVEDESAKEFRAADGLQKHRRTLVRLDILLVGALALCTLAQVSRRRRFTQLFFGAGAATFAVATLLFAAVEL